MKNIRWSYFSRSWAALSTAGLCGMYSVLSFAILLCPPRPRFLPRLLCWHGHYLHRDRKVVGIALLHLAPFISVQFVGHQPAGGSRSGVVTNSESIWKQHWGYCWEYLVAFHNLPQPFWFGLLAGISSMEALFWSHVLPFAKSRNDLPLMSKLRAVSKTAVTEMEWKETVWKSMKDEAQDSVGAVFTENPSHHIYMQKYIAARLLRKVKVLRNDLSLTEPLDGELAAFQLASNRMEDNSLDVMFKEAVNILIWHCLQQSPLISQSSGASSHEEMPDRSEEGEQSSGYSGKMLQLISFSNELDLLLLEILIFVAAVAEIVLNPWDMSFSKRDRRHLYFVYLDVLSVLPLFFTFKVVKDFLFIIMTMGMNIIFVFSVSRGVAFCC